MSCGQPLFYFQDSLEAGLIPSQNFFKITHPTEAIMRLTKISKGKGMWAYTTFSMIRNFLNYLLTLIHFKHLSNCPQTWHSLPPSVHSLLFSPFLALYFSLSIFLCLSSSLLFFFKVFIILLLPSAHIQTPCPFK